MPEALLVGETNSPVLKDAPSNGSSCPSLASDASSQASGSVELSNTEHERPVALTLQLAGQYKDEGQGHLIIWSKWLEEEPNPVVEHGAVHRQRHLSDLFAALNIYSEKLKIRDAGDSGRVDDPTTQRVNSNEPVDGGGPSGRGGTCQITANAHVSPRKSPNTSHLGRDIRCREGSDKSRHQLGIDIFTVKTAKSHFRCYWFKRFPTDHEDCGASYFQGERAVRTVS